MQSSHISSCYNARQASDEMAKAEKSWMALERVWRNTACGRNTVKWGVFLVE